MKAEMDNEIAFIAPQIKAFLDSLNRDNINDKITRLGLVNLFVRAIYLCDDRMTLFLNGGDRPITIDDILPDEIAGHFKDAISGRSPCSPLVTDAPPRQNKAVRSCGGANTATSTDDLVLSHQIEAAVAALRFGERLEKALLRFTKYRRPGHMVGSFVFPLVSLD